MRQVERMGVLDGGEMTTPSSSNREIPIRVGEDLLLDEMDTADHDMDTDDKDGSSQEEMDSMVMSLSASDEVTQRLSKTWHDVEKVKKNKKMER